MAKKRGLYIRFLFAYGRILHGGGKFVKALKFNGGYAQQIPKIFLGVAAVRWMIAYIQLMWKNRIPLHIAATYKIVFIRNRGWLIL